MGYNEIQVKNIPPEMTVDRIKELFSDYGTVSDVNLPTDRETGRPRGFAFVTMATSTQAENAIAALDGAEVDGQTLVVQESKPREKKSVKGERKPFQK